LLFKGSAVQDRELEIISLGHKKYLASGIHLLSLVGLNKLSASRHDGMQLTQAMNGKAHGISIQHVNRLHIISARNSSS